MPALRLGIKYFLFHWMIATKYRRRSLGVGAHTRTPFYGPDLGVAGVPH